MVAKLLLALTLLGALVPFFDGVTASTSLPPLNGSNGGFSLLLAANNHLLPPGTATNITVNAISPPMCPLADMVYAVMVVVGTEHGSHEYELTLDMAT